MPTFEPEAGPSGVVEVPQPPIAAVMAAFALIAEPPLVGVILVVARHAFRLGILELSRGMAFFAFHNQVPAQQGKTGEAVVDHGLLPVLCAMALLAKNTKQTKKHDNFPVAGVTGHGRIPV